jgi:hypothetical protein
VDILFARLPSGHDEVLETVAIHGPFPVACRAWTPERRDSLAMLIKPDGRGQG